MLSAGDEVPSLVAGPPIVAPAASSSPEPPTSAPAAASSSSSTAKATASAVGAACAAVQREDDLLGDLKLLNEAYKDTSSHALTIEKLAIDIDRAGDIEQALAIYKQAADQYKAAASACPEGNADRAALAKRAGQILGRVVYLETLGGAKPSLPPEEHILPSDRFEPLEGEAGEEAGGWRGRVKQTASAAAVGGTVGLLVLHAPVVAAVAAAGTAYATTRKDAAGEAARSLGDAGLSAAAKAQHVSEEHGVPDKVRESLIRVQEKAEQLGVTEKVEAAKATSWRALQEFDSRHDVSAKVANGLSQATIGATAATAKLAGWWQSRTSR